MKIDLKKLHVPGWFEDTEGNAYYLQNVLPDEEYFTYHSIFPCMFVEPTYAYTYHPEHLHEENRFYQAMLHFKWFYRFMYNRMKKRGSRKTFKRIFESQTTYTAGSDCIVAMVNSGDYTLSEAIYIYASSCERCMNVLERKYLGENFGYEEHSEKWKKANTVCDWCREEGYVSRRC